MMATLGAHEHVALKFIPVQLRVALGALDPYALWHGSRALLGADARRHEFFKPAHGRILSQFSVRVGRQIELGRIFYVVQRQPVRRCRNAAPGPVAAIEYLAAPLDRLVTTADRNQRTRDVPHHVHQERVGRHIQVDRFAIPAHRNTADVADRRRGLAAGGPKRREIMLPHEALRRLVHSIRIELAVNPPGSMPIQRGALQAIEYPIVITPGRGRVTRMKIVADGTSPREVDVVGKIAIGSQQPAARVTLTRRFEMRNLAGCVHAGVRATGTGYFDGFIGNRLQCGFDMGLDSVPDALALPAIVRRAVVLQTDGDTHSLAGE